MPEPLRSPKQSRAAAKSRSHPYYSPTNSRRTARDVGVERSSSLFGTLKSIVTAPLSWLASGEPKGSNGVLDGDHVPKRKVSFDERSGTPPKSKRVRLSSPMQEEEPVGSASSSIGSKRQLIPLWDLGNGVPRARMMPIDQPQPPVDAVEIPLPPSRGVSRVSMSVEPLDKFAARKSMTRDRSLPPPSPFARAYSSVSLTPQPAGATFGPSPRHKRRESSVPSVIPLSVPPVPTFVRPPSSTMSANIFRRQEPSEGPIMSLMSQTRQSLSPVRQSSETSMLGSVDATPQRPPTQAEKTLATLETYRTALHPPRFPSATYPEDRRPRKVHVPLPSKLGFDHVPNGKKKRPSIVQPYSTEMSGMRKLLQRRKRELEEEKLQVESHSPDDMERNDSRIVSDNDVHMQNMQSEEKGRSENDKKDMEREKEKEKIEEKEKEKEDVATATQVNGKAADAPVRTSKAESYIGLRVPTSRLTRTHAPAPRPRNKFSLKDDEDDEQVLTVEELKSFQAKLPPQLLFASMRRMSEASMQTEASAEIVTRASSPPLPTQPQSFDTLLSRIGQPVQKPALEFPPEAAKVDSQIRSNPNSEATSTTVAPTVLPFSLGVPKPAVPKSTDTLSPFSPGPSATPVPLATPPLNNGVPSFFSNTKIQFTPPTLPSGPLFGVQSASAGERGHGGEETVATPSAVGGEQANGTKPTLQYNPIAKDTSAALTQASTATLTPPISAEAQNPASSFEAKVSSEPSSKSISILGAATKPTDAALSDTPKSPFAINSGLPTPSPSTELGAKITTNVVPNVAPAPVKPAFNFATPPAMNTTPFVFGRTDSTTKTPDTSTAPASSFTYGTTPLTPMADKKTLSFGPATTPSFDASISSGVSGSVFTGFGTGTTTDLITPKPAETKLDNGDSMEVADRMDESPTRNGEKKDTVSFAPPQTSTFAAFGTSTGGGFTFGQPKPDIGPNTTGFSFDSSNQTRPSTSAFAFGPKPDTTFKFGQGTPASGFSFGTNRPEQSAALFGASVNPSPFTATPPTTSSGATFSFGQGTTTTAAPPAFGQSKPETGTNTAPSSPFLGPQQNPTSSPSFMFSLPSGPNPFGGPKPADGATPSSPSTTTPFQFGQSNGQPSSSPALFNIGSAAATPPRKVKALPTRRPKRP